eukprot:gnl/Chilomastix_cuspidata/2753.p2 GENE.gnl/Chilomastix_cuspidata/2753~~gnl/Chilomastix_cuspidata/2753.p2  ORF type:complete len:282 (-),score=60.76 gnl/Chilomastix_cuspidata/2753:3547-4392(-)
MHIQDSCATAVALRGLLRRSTSLDQYSISLYTKFTFPPLLSIAEVNITSDGKAERTSEWRSLLLFKGTSCGPNILETEHSLVASFAVASHAILFRLELQFCKLCTRTYFSPLILLDGPPNHCSVVSFKAHDDAIFTAFQEELGCPISRMPLLRHRAPARQQVRRGRQYRLSTQTVRYSLAEFAGGFSVFAYEPCRLNPAAFTHAMMLPYSKYCARLRPTNTRAARAFFHAFLGYSTQPPAKPLCRFLAMASTGAFTPSFSKTVFESPRCSRMRKSPFASSR